MRKLLFLAIIPMFLMAMSCQKSTEAPAPETSPSEQMSPAAPEMSPSPEASPAAPEASPAESPSPAAS